MIYVAFEVDYITLGDASSKLNVPSATLRHWTDQIEDYEVHFVKRNNRNERIYYDTDIEIFAYLRDLKKEYGRKTTTRDIAYMILDKGTKGEFQLRRREDAPVAKQTNRTADLLNQEDIQRLMQSERVRQFIEVIINERDKSLREEIAEDLRETIREEIIQELKLDLRDMSQNINERLEGISTMITQNIEEERKKIEERDLKTLEFFNKYKKNIEDNTENINEIKKYVQKESERIEKEKENKEKKGFLFRLFGFFRLK